MCVCARPREMCAKYVLSVSTSRVVMSLMTYLQTTPLTALLQLGSRRRHSTSKWTFPYPRLAALHLTGTISMVQSDAPFSSALCSRRSLRYRLRHPRVSCRHESIMYSLQLLWLVSSGFTTATNLV